MKDIDKLLAKHSAKVKSITKALLDVVKKNASGATEKVHLGWRNVMYSYGGMKKCVCMIGPLTTYVNIYLPIGVKLKNPDHLSLEGVGKAMRHVKIRTLKDARRPALVRLIRAAAQLVR